VLLMLRIPQRWLNLRPQVYLLFVGGISERNFVDRWWGSANQEFALSTVGRN